ncbi:hypothetical protein A2852_02005 [Candidatus Adlerbacteria bacterium RIFCSPHIGHO2_01_FULL_54_23]|uniref:Uncharacterized protein n=3 Tax=Candidatus Adleribacteriota TaxID=1752736 RepID=A0A1F4XZG2_9BACT|nr:MAG: hypothetical protein UY83_C0005G0025 [Candidatus Adlerbacteria bacterium GW2011_GWA1_54_10]KKW36137.1 MAG: hypothetical protein UY84_C0001G0025 [Candidatus Adlerbacteria bacterium GW2011_GWA2_54_12]KKW37410.1 MAG: hypothetical protein UY86_C0009G0044 [Candidatus Adlerbacteria bacterium GW2011_GWB1_54_7]OGC79103.1 MAG: hypothetical protein A2852_02005 [Candidatus Adlerbacteria bacterium RIFCSPHIGHO2_01_FULL_54_23]OGC87034.1 MAG: hypothetical protein A3B33_03085 [Candidatus Adlerbacteria 
MGLSALKNSKIIQWGVIAAVIALGYFWYASSDAGPLLSIPQAPSPASQEILLTLGNLRQIVLDPSLFEDPIFTSLVDSSTSIPQESVGRRNPFAPIGR